MTKRGVNPHEAFRHDDLDSFGYDWSRAADPGCAPKRPLKLLLPETAEEVADLLSAMTEEERRALRIRGKGHSSNDLVLSEDRNCTVLCMEFMNRIRVSGDTVTLQAGAVLSEADAILAEYGLGFPVIGDHNEISAAGFASVGGVSAASHREGLFVDNVTAVQYVTRRGRVRIRTVTQPRRVRLLLARCGRGGVITEITCRVVPIDKRRKILRNQRAFYSDFRAFLSAARELMCMPSGVAPAGFMERGLWMDQPIGRRIFCVGQTSIYREVPPSWRGAFWNAVSHGYLHALGRVAGRLPARLDRLVQLLGVAGLILSPRWSSVRNIETFSDSVIDASVGDPSRMLIAFVPDAKFESVATRLYDLLREYREKTGCFTYIALYVKTIRSRFLQCTVGSPCWEIVMYLGLRPSVLTDDLLEEIVEVIDGVCVENGARRYMHTRTSKRFGEQVDPARCGP